MWLNICQGLVLLGVVCRMLHNVKVCAVGRDKAEPTGAVGIFSSLVLFAIWAAIVWRSGAFTTILPSP